jgi:hypothetical protein
MNLCYDLSLGDFMYEVQLFSSFLHLKLQLAVQGKHRLVQDQVGQQAIRLMTGRVTSVLVHSALLAVGPFNDPYSTPQVT